MKHGDITHRTVEKIIFWFSLIFFSCFGCLCFMSNMPLYVAVVMFCIPAVLAVFTFLPQLRGIPQAYASAICFEIAATVYGLANDSRYDMALVFLVIICITAMYRQVGLIVWEMLYVTSFYILDYLISVHLMGKPMIPIGEAIAGSVVFYVGCAAVIMTLLWFRSALRAEEQRTSELEDMYKLLEKQKADAEAGTREKADFLANMSHDMRTPMIAIVGMSQLFLNENSLTPVEAEYINTINTSANNLLNLINDILYFSKAEANMMQIEEETYNIESLLSEIANIINARIGDKEISFVAEIDANVPVGLIGDPERIHRILMNLLSNAVKFTESGVIKLKIGYELDDDGKSWLIASVSDSGIGIKPEEQKRLFDEFSQVNTSRNRKIEGTGLGLFIAKRLANMMNGDITLESVYGQGSTFTMTIEQRVADSTELAFVPDPDGYVAYIYEPNSYYRESLRSIINQLGLSVITISELALWDYYNADRFGVILFFDYASGIDSVNSFALKVRRMRLVALIDRNCFVDVGIKDNILMMHKPVLTGQLAALIRGENLDAFKRKKKQENKLFVPDAKIMIVDDNLVNLKVLDGLISVFKPQTKLVSSGREAYELLKQDRSYDLIFMDHMMPEWDGVETVQKIRSIEGQYYADLPIVAVSANVSRESRELFLSNGMNDFVEKPVTPGALTKVIRKFIPEEKQLNEYVERKNPMMTSNRPRNEYISAATKPSAEEIVISGVDSSYGIFNMGGSVDVYNNILNVVLDDGRKKIVYLEKYAMDGNLKAYNIETHALKSVAASIGAMELSRIAAEHENASVSGDLRFVQENYRSLINEYTALLGGIEKYLTANNLLTLRAEDINEGENAQPISEQKKHNEVVGIIQLIERFDSDGAIEKLHELLKYHLDSDDRSAVRLAINQLDDYMFDEAIQSLSSM